jgi:multiple sugar transport system permease protein
VKNYINKIKKSNNLLATIFLLPALIPLVVFWIWPMIYSFYISLTDWDYMSPEYNMVGLENYINLLGDTEFHKVIINTLYFSIGTLIPTIIGGLFLALLLNRKLKGSNFYRIVLFSPWITPTVAVSIVWTWIFEPRVGLANYVLSIFNLPKLQWLHSSEWAMVGIIIVTVWKGLGWTMLFYISALKKVPDELYEAASIDGATYWEKFKNVTLPMISPTTFFLIIINIINSLQAYDQIQVMTQGGPAGSTRTMLYMYYQSAFERFNMGEATAVATVLIIITAGLAAIQFMFSRKWVHY